MPRITVLVRHDVAPALLQRAAASEASRDILLAASELGVALQPMHPGVTDPNLAGYFSVDVPDHDAAQRLIDRLIATDAVEAAYVKPPDAAP